MTKPNSLLRGICDSATLALACVVFLSGCGKSGTQSSSGGGSEKKTTVANIGSDTMVNIAAAWAEAYGAVDKTVLIEVNGGGSGVGIKGLINGTAEIANSSRHIEDKERAELKEKRQLDAKEFIVGIDALSIYVHKDNPLNEITMEQLGEIYRSDGKITKWTELGVSSIPGGKGDEIIRVSRQNNSGTYEYFKEVVVGKRNEFKLGSLDMNGSKDVVELVGKTPNAIGYSGMGYANPSVKTIKVAKKKGDPYVAPSIATTQDKSYPIARPMFVYTAGEPAPHLKKYIDWTLSEEGQKLLLSTGYVPVPKK
ncbi:MAG: phosphate ABC transporter substrate-binding protein [Verrucomicrobia bacterium]|nr:phosphate ABC transporter substrate-binding protein [Verrucomicrobiota bacterium]